MYEFSDGQRRAYEAMPVPLAFFQYTEDGLRTLLVSDGLCRMMEMEREPLAERLRINAFGMIHPEDAGKVAKAASSFARKTGGYDVIFRSKLTRSGEYHFIHSIGARQTMDDGSEIMCILYIDLGKSQSETVRQREKYDLFQQDRFYIDPLTGLPNLNYFNSFGDNRAASMRLAGQLL